MHRAPSPNIHQWTLPLLWIVVNYTREYVKLKQKYLSQSSTRAGKVVAVAFVYFRKALHLTVFPTIHWKWSWNVAVALRHVPWLDQELSWWKTANYCGEWTKVTSATCFFWHFSEIGATFTLFTNDFSSSVGSGSLYMHADYTTFFCRGETEDTAIAQLSAALQLHVWCINNRLSPQSSRQEWDYVTQ